MASIVEVLNEIQKGLKVPKENYNSFGKYNYRSCEDILEGVKPLLAKAGAIITLNDEIVLIGERYYIKATATLKVGNESLATTGFAREEEAKKGMDGSQVTGASSSYARKYALNGLLAIDDTKDSDTTNSYHEHIKPKTPNTSNIPKPSNTNNSNNISTIPNTTSTSNTSSSNNITKEQLDILKELAVKAGLTESELKTRYTPYILTSPFKGLYDRAINELTQLIEERNNNG